MSSSSLSSVVSNLVRASMGSSVPTAVADEEVDRYVADLIVKEAKQKAERYLKDGVQAYLPDKESDSNLPKANKRFLSAIIRNTDEHNRAILRAQAEAAQEAKTEKEERERKERRVRALEATEAERLRRLMGGSSRRRDTEWDRRHGSGRRRSRDSRDGDSAGDRDDYHDRRRRHRSRSRSPSRKEGDTRHHRRRRRDEEREDGTSQKRRRRSRSKSSDDERHKYSKCEGSRKHKRRDETPEPPSRSKGKGKEPEGPPKAAASSYTSAHGTPRDEISPEVSDEDLETPSKQSSHRSLTPTVKPPQVDLSTQFQARKAKLASTPPPPPSPTLSEEEDIERYRPRRRRRVSAGRAAAKQDDAIASDLPSKMDRYFEESYDPRLDTGPLTVPNIPSTGLIEGSEFEGWEAMLDIIRQRREDKVERKRLERLGLLPEKKSKEKDGKSPKPSEAWTMDSGTSALDIKYDKRGSVREWDLGKTGF